MVRGQILANLETSGQADNTVVVFTSDHGDMMGDHGLMLKGFMHYRGTLQVPLVIAAPGTVPARTRRLAGTVDLAPTLLDLCGVPAFYGIQGRSLRPILDDPTAEVRHQVLIEDDLPASDYMPKNPVPTKTRTVVTETARYTRNSNAEEQLFDLMADHHELSDLKRRDPALKSTMTELMMDALIEADDVARGGPAVPISG